MIVHYVTQGIDVDNLITKRTRCSCLIPYIVFTRKVNLLSNYLTNFSGNSLL